MQPRSLEATTRPGGAAGLFCLVIVFLALGIVGCASNRRQQAAHDFARWEKDIAAFEAADRARPPEPGGVLFVGSSTIRMWKTLEQDFPGQNVINRGFGGSEIVDATYFADRIVIPYRPRMIVFRSGGNDIHNGKLPDEVARDFAQFVRKVHKVLPQTQIVFIAWNPAPVRWTEKDKNQALNVMVRRAALSMPRVSFVDVFDMTVTADGMPREELFLPDRLHFNAEGYKLLAERVRPFVLSR